VATSGSAARLGESSTSARAPTASDRRARVKVDNLTRSGLVLSSRPIDLALVARLSPSLLQARAVMQDEGQTEGRLQASISNLPPRARWPTGSTPATCSRSSASTARPTRCGGCRPSS
jgi:translocation and assembly module TamB